MRLFTCIMIPEEIKYDIVNFQKKLLETPIKAKFVEKENLHITITFIGEKNESETIDLIKKLNELEGIKPFKISLGDLKIIPKMDYIKIIGLNVNDTDGALNNLIKKVVNNLGGSYHLESKMTLCRVSKILNKKQVLDFLNKNFYIKFGDFEVREIDLMKSTLTMNGPIYEIISKKRFE